MKKLLLMGAISLFAGMNAQTEKGSWMVSGKTGIGFSSANTKYTTQGKSLDGPKVSSFEITPSVGYFAVKDLAIGVDLGFKSTKTTFKNTDLGQNYEQKQSMFTIMPNATYFFVTGSSVRPYLGAGIGYGSVTSSELYNNDKETTKGGLLWGAKGGFLYLLNSMVGLDLGVGYQSLTTKETVLTTEIKTTANAFGVNAGVVVFFK